MDDSELAGLFSQLDRDLRDGLLERKPLSQAAYHKMAMAISSRRMTLSSRALDILHVSAALILGASSFASFDIRQRNLAQAEGLMLSPAKL